MNICLCLVYYLKYKFIKMGACVAYGCSNKHNKKIPGVTYHRFPKDLKLRKAWINAIKRKNWKPSIYSRLCSEHFTKDQVIRVSPVTVRLRKGSVPSIFNFPPHIKKVLEEKKKIESTYKDADTNENTPSCVEGISNCDENSEPYDHNDQINNIKINKVFSVNTLNDSAKVGNLELNTHKLDFPNSISAATKSEAVVLPTSSSNTCSNSSFIKLQYVSPIVLNELSSRFLAKKTVNTCDASTITERTGCVEYELRQQLANNNLLLNRYRKKIKTLQQQNRRYKDRLRNIKHSIFAELLKRQYLSSDNYFKTGQQDCLLDRQSIKTCASSESEKSDEEEGIV